MLGRKRTEVEHSTERNRATRAECLIDLLKDGETDVADKAKYRDDNQQNSQTRHDAVRVDTSSEQPADWAGCVVAENAEYCYSEK